MFDVVVTGRSLPALSAALDCAEMGLAVLVTADPAGTASPRHKMLDPDGVVRSFLERVAAPIEGSGSQPNAAVLPREYAPERTSLRDSRGAWAPLAEPSVCGIPAMPIDVAALRIIGNKAGFRAYLDRIRPLLTVGKTKELGVLVSQRMGRVVLERLVDPLVRERFGVAANAVDVTLAAPGLNEALTRQGALSTAVLAYAERDVERETRVSAVGGEAAVRAELLRKLALYNVTITSEAVSSVTRLAAGWQLHLTDATQFETRALVLDCGRSAVAGELQQQLCPETIASETRVHAAIAGVAPSDQQPKTSTLTGVTGWSVRSTVDAVGKCTITVSSDVRGRAEEEPVPADLDGVLAAAMLTAAPDAIWDVSVTAAPFASVEARDAALSRISGVTTDDSHLMLVGSSLHGDDLGHALEQAASDTLLLRRRLLGLID